jgi:prepilin-type N-terminal cleavage/methylation domain-containing protein
MHEGNCLLRTNRMRRRTSRKAFTLIEMMIVVLIIGTLLNMALPSIVSARNTSQTKACIANLTTIQSAKQEWALDTNESGTETPTWADISPYIRSTSNVEPLCPTSQQPYDLGSVDEPAQCPTYPLTHILTSY